MKGQLSQETTVKVPIDEFWDAFRGLNRPRLLNKLLPNVVGKPEVLQGDGGVGTIVKIASPRGVVSGSYTKELYTKIDDEKRIQEIEIIEGGFKDIGFDSYVIRLEIVEKDNAETIVVRSTIHYEIDDELAVNVSKIPMKYFGIVIKAIAKYVNKNKPTA